MSTTFSPSHNPVYPYYGQPYHTYVPPGYPQQHPRTAFPAPTAPPEAWPREKLPFPDPTPHRLQTSTSGYYPEQTAVRAESFVPQNPDTDAGRTQKSRSKRASTIRPQQVSEKPPVKSALKKNPAKHLDSFATVPLERTRTSSSARQRLAPTTRPRSNANPSFVPGNHFTHLTFCRRLTPMPSSVQITCLSPFTAQTNSVSRM